MPTLKHPFKTEEQYRKDLETEMKKVYKLRLKWWQFFKKDITEADRQLIGIFATRLFLQQQLFIDLAESFQLDVEWEKPE